MAPAPQSSKRSRARCRHVESDDMTVLVIVIRGLHLGYVGCYGNSWLGTLNLNRLASEGIVFDHHYADHPSAAGAVHAWRTGRYGFPTDAGALPPGEDLFALLRAAGARLALVTDASRPETTAF